MAIQIGFLFFLIVNSSFAQSSLPPCEGTSSAKWMNCFGTENYSDGGTYTGEWGDGRPNGKGTGVFADGSKYFGEWKGGMANGRGVATFASGYKYEGEFKDNLFNGQGTATAIDGKKYVGEFKDGKPTESKPSTPSSQLPDCNTGDSNYWHQCFGIKIFSDGSRYIGEFVNGNYNGLGISYNVNPVAVSQKGYWISGVLNSSINLNIQDFPFNGIRLIKINIEELVMQNKKITAFESGKIITRENTETNNTPALGGSVNIPLEKAQAKCRELGFKPKTEGFGKCVLQLSK